MKRRLIIAFLYTSQALGLFRLARRLTKDRLRILCYHGFSMADEVKFRTKLFMTPEVFQERMQYLAREGFPVLPLPQALAKLEQGVLPPSATVITIDDGFYSVHRIARDILNRQGFPATLYVTTYYFQKQVPIYRLLISYILWKAPSGQCVDLGRVGVPGLAKRTEVVLTSREKDRLCSLLVSYGEALGDETMRQSIARDLAEAINVDYEAIRRTRILSLIDEQEARELEQAGIDIQLHTHRHTFPIEPAGAKRELGDNRRVLDSALGKTARDFCYPSGEWSPAHWAILEAFEISSATTCDTGLAVQGCNRYALPRILDDMRVSQIEFKAEMSGYMDITRDVRARLAGRRSGPRA
jgi:peptidoglycan/xylan/chitin deacetylase (PgdA/CDA1 family)